MDPKSILWDMYKEQCAFMRHHETQRSTIVNYILIIGGGIISVISGGGFTRIDIPLAVLLLFVGLFGALFSLSSFERYHRHKQRASAYRDELDNLILTNGTLTKSLSDIKSIADRETRTSYKEQINKLKGKDQEYLRLLTRVHTLWVVLPVLLSITGLVLLVLSIIDCPSPSK